MSIQWFDQTVLMDDRSIYSKHIFFIKKWGILAKHYGLMIMMGKWSILSKKRYLDLVGMMHKWGIRSKYFDTQLWWIIGVFRTSKVIELKS